jgi:hypothetical protein
MAGFQSTGTTKSRLTPRDPGYPTCARACAGLRIDSDSGTPRGDEGQTWVGPAGDSGRLPPSRAAERTQAAGDRLRLVPIVVRGRSRPRIWATVWTGPWALGRLRPAAAHLPALIAKRSARLCAQPELRLWPRRAQPFGHSGGRAVSTMPSSFLVRPSQRPLIPARAGLHKAAVDNKPDRVHPATNTRGGSSDLSVSRASAGYPSRPAPTTARIIEERRR